MPSSLLSNKRLLNQFEAFGTKTKDDIKSKNILK